MYNPKSLKAEEFISDEEIMETLAYADANNPGGQAVMVTTSAQYKTISVQGIQGRVICKNTVLVPDIKAGLVKPATVDGSDADGQGTG